MKLAELTTSPLKLPAPERMFLLSIILVSGLVTVPQVLDLGFLTGLGLWTLLIGCFSWGLWFVRPFFPRELAGPLVPLGAFSLFAACSPLWGHPDGTAWIQLLTVLVGFLGLTLLAAREAERHPGFVASVQKAMDTASLLAAIGYTLTFLIFGAGNDAMFEGRPLFMARPFALFAVLAVARQLARFHAGDRGGLYLAVWLTVTIILSQSRLALVSTLLLFPISFLLVGGKKNTFIAFLTLGLGTMTMSLLLLFSDEMYKRFFGYDASLQVGGVSINASGRTAAWIALMADIHTPDQWLFGHGAGTSSAFCSLHFENLPHPHNDYIRFLYDFGLFALGWFLLFLWQAIAMVWRALRQAIKTGDRPELALQLATLMSIAALMAAMATDNPVDYIFVMAPLAILLGAALSRPHGVAMVKPLGRAAKGDGLDWIFEQDANGGSLEIRSAMRSQSNQAHSTGQLGQLGQSCSS